MTEAALNEREAGAVATARLVMGRLRQVLEEECAVLQTRSAQPLEALTARKNQLLRDLIVAQRGCASPAALDVLAPDTRSLKPVLVRNQHLLKTHIDAVKEISAIIVDAIRQSESDGTYSRYD